MAIKITNAVDEIFGNLVVVTNGIIELKVTVDFGPRVIHFSRVGMENMFYNDKDKKVLGEPQPEFDNEQIKLYGGHRLWVSPEILPACYYPDNNKVEVIQTGDTLTFVSPVERFNNIQKIIEIEMFDNVPSVSVTHKVKNCGAYDIEIAPWAITMCDVGGIEVMPMPNRKTGYLHNRNFSFWDYTSLNDERVYFGKDFMTLKQDINNTQPFKLGYNNENGWSAYFNKGQVFVKYFEPLVDGFYPDNGCSFETYTCEFMLEVESLGQMQVLGLGDTAVHIEEWELHEEKEIPTNNEEDIKKLVSKFIS